MDLSNEISVREHFAKRLQSCGLKVNLDGTRWHTAGDSRQPGDRSLPSEHLAPNRVQRLQLRKHPIECEPADEAEDLSEERYDPGEAKGSHRRCQEVRPLHRGVY